MEPSSGETIARLHEVIRTGSSSPAIVETGDGERFVLKLAGAGAGRLGLLTEFLANGIAECVGLRVAPARPLFLPKNFPWQIGTDEFDDLVKRSDGWNLGIAFLPDAVPLGADELAELPADFLGPLMLADRLLQNVDRTAKNPNLLRSPQGLFAIDFGSCLFLNRIAARRTSFPFALPPNHFLAGTPRALRRRSSARQTFGRRSGRCRTSPNRVRRNGSPPSPSSAASWSGGSSAIWRRSPSR